MAVARHHRTVVRRARTFTVRFIRSLRGRDEVSSSTRLHDLREQSSRLRSIELAFDVSLGRPPSDAELEYWLARCDEGFMPWDVVSSLVAGEEVRAAPDERDEAVRDLV